MYSDKKAWYHLDLTKEKAEILKKFLRQSDIYYEPSENGTLIHFECRMTRMECDLVNEFIRKGVNNVQSTA